MATTSVINFREGRIYESKDRFLYDRCRMITENDDSFYHLGCLGKLPREIRDTILAYVLAFSSKSDIEKKKPAAGLVFGRDGRYLSRTPVRPDGRHEIETLEISTSPGILRASKRLYVEGSQVLFRISQFSMNTYSTPNWWHGPKVHVLLKRGFDYEGFKQKKYKIDRQISTTFGHKLVSRNLLCLIRHLSIYIGSKTVFSYHPDAKEKLIPLKFQKWYGYPPDRRRMTIGCSTSKYISQAIELITQCQHLQTLDIVISHFFDPEQADEIAAAYAEDLERLAQPVGARNVQITPQISSCGRWAGIAFTSEFLEYLQKGLSHERGSKLAAFTKDHFVLP